jgi:hypothetical protein
MFWTSVLMIADMAGLTIGIYFAGTQPMDWSTALLLGCNGPLAIFSAVKLALLEARSV